MSHLSDEVTMAYTAADLENVQAALIALATGQRVVTLTIGDKTITYGHQAQIGELRALRDEISGKEKKGQATFFPLLI